MAAPALVASRRTLLHTDEYEIALFREVDVCSGQIRRHQRLLDSMEQRHNMTTAVFLDRARLGDLPAALDFKEWQGHADALQRWQETRDEYERLLGVMKISAA
jgi:hypothetical protein